MPDCARNTKKEREWREALNKRGIDLILPHLLWRKGASSFSHGWAELQWEDWWWKWNWHFVTFLDIFKQHGFGEKVRSYTSLQKTPIMVLIRIEKNFLGREYPKPNYLDAKPGSLQGRKSEQISLSARNFQISPSGNWPIFGTPRSRRRPKLRCIFNFCGPGDTTTWNFS